MTITNKRVLREVSPVGTSRFEQPYILSGVSSSRPTSTTAPPTTTTATPTTMEHPSLAASPQLASNAGSANSSRRKAADSLFSHNADNDTYKEAVIMGPVKKVVDSLFSSSPNDDTMKEVAVSPTSFASSDRHLHTSSNASTGGSPACVVNPDDWFARFHSDADYEGTESDICPDRATLSAVKDIPIFDAEGNERTFGSIYDPSTATHQRQLVIFVRHFYCGACQAYLKALTESFPMAEYFSIPTPTSIVIIGCGQPDLLSHYKGFTDCPFPMFTDPSRELFKKFGMVKTLKIGRQRPEYMKEISTAAWGAGQVKTINKSLKDPEGIKLRDVSRGGNPLQIGGEFLFDEGEVIWCHRMTHMRDHTEMPALRKLLEMDD